MLLDQIRASEEEVMIHTLEVSDEPFLEGMKLGPECRIIVESKGVLQALKLHMELQSFNGGVA